MALLRPWRSMPQAWAAEAVSDAKPEPLAMTAMRLPRGRRLVAKPETAAVNSSKEGTSVAPARSTSAASAPSLPASVPILKQAMRSAA